MIGVINAIIYGRLRALRRAFEPLRGGGGGGEKTLPIEAADRGDGQALFQAHIRSARILSRLSARPLVAVYKPALAVAKAKHGAVVCTSINIFTYFNAQIVVEVRHHIGFTVNAPCLW